MPTFNQLVRKGRETSVKKSTAPALQKGYNSLHKKAKMCIRDSQGREHSGAGYSGVLQGTLKRVTVSRTGRKSAA